MVKTMNEKLRNITKQLLLIDELEECVYNGNSIITYNNEIDEFRVFIEKSEICGCFLNDSSKCYISIDNYYKMLDNTDFSIVTKRSQISILLHYIDNYKKYLNSIFDDIINNYNKKFYNITYIDGDNNKQCTRCEIYAINTFYSYGNYGCNGAHSEFVTSEGVLVLKHNISDNVIYDTDHNIITYNVLEHECKYKNHPKSRLLLIKKA